MRHGSICTRFPSKLQPTLKFEVILCVRGVISPILANLYLNNFDHSIEKTAWKLVRYADDFIILCKSADAAIQAMKTVRAMMERLHLELAPEKTRLTAWKEGFDFLGY